MKCAVCKKEENLTPDEALAEGWVKEEEVGWVDWICPVCEIERQQLGEGVFAEAMNEQYGEGCW